MVDTVLSGGWIIDGTRTPPYQADLCIQDGKIVRSAQIRVVRDGIVIFEDKISSLRRFKDDVRGGFGLADG